MGIKSENKIMIQSYATLKTKTKYTSGKYNLTIKAREYRFAAAHSS